MGPLESAKMARYGHSVIKAITQVIFNLCVCVCVHVLLLYLITIWSNKVKTDKRSVQGNPGTCLTEKLCIRSADKSTLLNKRSELATKGRHENRQTIRNRIAPHTFNEFKFCFSRRFGHSLIIASRVKLELL